VNSSHETAGSSLPWRRKPCYARLPRRGIP